MGGLPAYCTTSTTNAGRTFPPTRGRGRRFSSERGLDEEIVEAILSHAEWNQSDYPLDRPIRKALFSVDELRVHRRGGLCSPRKLDG